MDNETNAAAPNGHGDAKDDQSFVLPIYEALEKVFNALEAITADVERMKKFLDGFDQAASNHKRESWMNDFNSKHGTSEDYTALSTVAKEDGVDLADTIYNLVSEARAAAEQAKAAVVEGGEAGPDFDEDKYIGDYLSNMKNRGMRFATAFKPKDAEAPKAEVAIEVKKTSEMSPVRKALLEKRK